MWSKIRTAYEICLAGKVDGEATLLSRSETIMPVRYMKIESKHLSGLKIERLMAEIELSEKWGSNSPQA